MIWIAARSGAAVRELETDEQEVGWMMEFQLQKQGMVSGGEQGEKLSWFDRCRENAFACILFNAVFLAVILLIMRPEFDTNDDITIALFVNRARPIQDPHLLFINTIVGWVCAALYRATNMVPWYGVLQYFGLFCAFSAMTWVIQKLFPRWSAVSLSMFLLSFFAADAYTSVQFTKTAGICAAAGLFLVVFAMTRRHLSYGCLLVGGLITLYGYLYRDREAYVMFALWCVMGAGLLLRLGEVKKGRRLRRAGSYFGSLAFVLVLCAGAWGINQLSYRTSPEAAAYKELNDVRSDIMDYGFPSYEENKELYESLGITRSAYRLFSKWNFYDPDVFPLEAQKKILSVQKHNQLNQETIRDFFDKYPYKWFENPMFYCFLVMAVLVLAFGERKWQVILTLVLEIIAVTGVFFIMFFQGRYNLERVDSPIWFCLCLIFVFFLDKDRFVLSGRYAAVLVLVILALNQNAWRVHWKHNTKKKEAARVDNANRIAETARDVDHLYVSKLGLYSVSTAYAPLSLVPIDAASNMCVLGGWPAGSPSYVATLRKYGVENPYRDSINNDAVLWIDNHIDWTITYLHEYYDDQVEARKVGTFNGENMYQLVSVTQNSEAPGKGEAGETGEVQGVQPAKAEETGA